MYEIQMKCFFPFSGDFAITYPDDRKEYRTQEEAREAAYEMAEKEADLLNSDCDPDRSFGIPEDEQLDNVKVECYTEDDDTYEVTRYMIVEA